jgi:hypothetical protein
VNAEQRPAPLQMAIQSPLRSRDAGLWSGIPRVSDVDDNQVGLARFGQSLLYGFTDRHLVTKPGDDVGQTLGGLGKGMPRVAVATGSADDQDLGHARTLLLRMDVQCETAILAVPPGALARRVPV